MRKRSVSHRATAQFTFLPAGSARDWAAVAQKEAQVSEEQALAAAWGLEKDLVGCSENIERSTPMNRE
jgi:hypothetical protein